MIRTQRIENNSLIYTDTEQDLKREILRGKFFTEESQWTMEGIIEKRKLTFYGNHNNCFRQVTSGEMDTTAWKIVGKWDNHTVSKYRFRHGLLHKEKRHLHKREISGYHLNGRLPLASPTLRQKDTMCPTDGLRSTHVSWVTLLPKIFSHD